MCIYMYTCIEKGCIGISTTAYMHIYMYIYICGGYIGIVEKKMETTIEGLVFSINGKYESIPWSKEIILLRLREECDNGRRLYVGG